MLKRWEAGFQKDPFPCHIAIVDMIKKSKDNPLASNSELEERENDISINVVSDRDVKTSGIDFDDFISLQTRTLDI